MMTVVELTDRAAFQYQHNLDRYGKQPCAVLILETEDQVAKLRDAFLVHERTGKKHHSGEQLDRQIVNLVALMYAIGEQT